MFHPAAALHQPRYRSLIEEDVQRIPELLAQLDGADGEADPDPPVRGEQLSLF
jgi:DNA polymerase